MVENAEEITVRLTDKREFKAKVIGADTRSDVAVIKVDATSLPTVKIGDMSKLRVGEWVVAIGSPFGFANTVTAGIVSAKSRENLSGDPNLDAVPFIQTDVAVNPGNSGGPLLNMRGEVVGINSQIFSRTGSFAGISFAIPIDYAFNVADQLMKTGKVTRGRIGVGIQNVSRDLADSLGLGKAEGAVVGKRRGRLSRGRRAGLEVGDVITKIDGRAVEGSADLSRTIRALKPGSKVNLTVWRSGKTRDIPVTVAEFKDEEATKTASAPKAARRSRPRPTSSGLAVKELTPEQKKALKVTGGVAVEAADGAALAAGVGPGDVILRVNNTDITSVKAFNDAVAKLDIKKPVALLIKDENGHALHHVPPGSRLIRPKLTVLSRSYCHLCEDMIAALKQFQGRYPFEIEVVDVDRHPKLEEKWGDKVPVLLDGERELCHYFLDVEVLDARLARMK